MSNDIKDDIRQQVEGHLQSLRNAGVDWLPAAPPLQWNVAQASGNATALDQPPQPAKTPITGPQLFIPEEPSMPVKEGLTLDQRRLTLQMLAKEVSGCTRCPELASTRTQTVFADGSPGAELCFVGEAPGADEDAKGIPFVGVAGQLLNRIIEACGLKREEVYICNTIKCRPPGNRTPLPNETSNCRSFFERQLELVAPKVIVALGSCAATNLLGTTLSLGKLRGRFHDYRGIPVAVTYHPAYLLPHRSPDKKKDVWEDMKMVLTHLGRPIPKKKD